MAEGVGVSFAILVLVIFYFSLFIYFLCFSGAYAAFSGGGLHFKLERTSCQQSLKYISLYNTEGAPFSTEKRNIFLCT